MLLEILTPDKKLFSGDVFGVQFQVLMVYLKF